MEEILRALIATDKNILAKRDDLIAALEKSVPSGLRQDYAAIRRAIMLNVGEIFATGNSNPDAAKYKALKVLAASGLNEERVAFVVKIFSRALGWDKFHGDNEIELLIARVKKLEDELAALKESNLQLAARVKALESSPSATNPAPSTPPEFIITPPPAAVPQLTPPATKFEFTDESFTFLEEYHALFKLFGRERRQARNAFLRKFSVRAFDCQNFEARMIEPVPPPIFVNINSVVSGAYWAVLLAESNYAVFPNVDLLFYTENRHKAQAMGEVFDSNFEGGSYKKIFVVRPAIFECLGETWRFLAKGELTLDN